MQRAQKIFRSWDQLKEVTGLGKTKLLELIKAGEFPKPVRLAGTARGWLENDIAEWQQGCESYTPHREKKDAA